MNYFNEIKLLKEKKLISDNVKDLLDEYTKRLTENNVPVIYNLRHLRKYLNIKKKDQDKLFGVDRDALYKEFYIPKKSGGFRKIQAPSEFLETRQRWVKENILDKIKFSDYAKGFKKKTSIVDNAKEHCNKKYVLNIDLKNFFPSINYSKVFKLFCYIGYTRGVSHLLTKLCTNEQGALPQGAPTSPCISNLVNLKLDKRLSCFAHSIGGVYTRYADDITISSNSNPYNYMQTITKIVNEEGYQLNNKKTRIQNRGQKQEVTGLVVNDKVSVSRKIKKELNNAIYYIKKYGIEEHIKHIKCDKIHYKEHLFGLAYFVKMVNPDLGINYLNKLNALKWQY